ncbi:hypothetical protein Ccrd_016915 [Cynara cardunculus var. scolymus]|uniref:Uncharacterized protein n=1 Tax=Cynara cardunculus var. scolymus TaxID=59895 RepID=A0A103Y922_CYNCS|nr:hypothetical protein Ccrd_016915 [Cynara cardunculus var. scolymus]
MIWFDLSYGDLRFKEQRRLTWEVHWSIIRFLELVKQMNTKDVEDEHE